jgi:cell wall-associated NlpC family hydrolase
MTRRQFAVWYGESFLGTWYKWGGDDPSGIDCSGLAVEICKAVGIVPRGKAWDATADTLLNLFRKKGWEIHESDARGGCFVFWLNDTGRAIHVEMVAKHPQISIGASGGGSRVRSVQDAIRANAFVKARPWASRRGPRVFCDPFRKEEIEVGLPE